MAARLQESHAQIESQNESLRKGLDLAREIQIGLLPDRVPWDAQLLTVYGRSIPAAEVGGDLYLFVDTRVQYRGAIAIGDISGKGIPAALMMALLSSAVEVQAREVERPAGLLTILNGQLSGRLKASRMNAGLLYMLIDLEHASLAVANAGMISPLLLRDGKVEFLEVYGLPLGSGLGRYSELKMQLQPGDLVLLISDGIVEARNAGGELFGFERLEQTVNEHLAAAHPGLLVDVLISRVEAFMDSAHQQDDMTVVLIQPNLALVDQRFQRSEELLV
jgi:serine phosphatase RsbU (regulator of sigma subunit)